MQPARQQWGARLLLAAMVALAAGWLARVDYGRKISTDVLDLIPRDEREPELALARSLATERQARVALFALSGPDAGQRARAAQAFAVALAASPAFVEVVPMGERTARDAVARHVFENRFDLLAPGWLARMDRDWRAAGQPDTLATWAAGKTAADLDAFLARPEAVAFGDLLPQDPLLLLPSLALQMEGLSEPPADTGTHALVWARTRDAPLSEEGQGPVFAAVQAALEAARAIEPTAEVEWAAISRFAAESRDRIRNEMSGLNVLSLFAVLMVAALCVRRVTRVLHLAPILVCAVLAAWTAVTFAFERVHILVFVVGSLLGGVAVDYGFYLYLQPLLRPGEPYVEKVRRLIKPLLTSALTTILGFSLLLFSDLPLIQQLGVFVGAGLVGALGSALLWFAQVNTPFLETRAFARARVAVAGPRLRVAARVLLGAGAIVAVAGPWLLQWRDDIRELEVVDRSLRDEALAVRAMFGETGSRTAYITRGTSAADTRAALDRLARWHEAAFPGAPLASLGLVLPLPEDRAALPERLAAFAGFSEALHGALDRAGYEAAEFQPFFEAWERWRSAPPPDYDTVVRSLAGALAGPLALTMATGPDGCWFVSVAEHPPGEIPPGDTATIPVDQLQSLNHLFLRYRLSALRLSGIGLGLVGLSVLLLYGPRRGIAIFALPAGASLFTFGVLGLAGQPLNLFHLLGAFLGVCLSHDYAIFTAENARRGEAPPPSIRLSALTTAASFGVLTLSRIPAVAALGTTVSMIVLAALVAVEIVPLARRATTDPDGR